MARRGPRPYGEDHPKVAETALRLQFYLFKLRGKMGCSTETALISIEFAPKRSTPKDVRWYRSELRKCLKFLGKRWPTLMDHEIVDVASVITQAASVGLSMTVKEECPSCSALKNEVKALSEKLCVRNENEARRRVRSLVEDAIAAPTDEIKVRQSRNQIRKLVTEALVTGALRKADERVEEELSRTPRRAEHQEPERRAEAVRGEEEHAQVVQGEGGRRAPARMPKLLRREAIGKVHRRRASG